MAALFIWDGGDVERWQREMRAVLGDFDLRVYPDIGPPEDIEFALVWMPPLGVLARLPNLKAIFSIGAGVSHILRDPEVPKHVPIVRLVYETLTHDMTLHVLHWVLHFHRNFHVYARDQREIRWKRLTYPETPERRIGVLGLGEIGGPAAKQIADLGFTVAGWSRQRKDLPGIRCLAGEAELPALLAQSDILVNLLPPTPQTQNLLDAERLALLPKGAFLINVGRGDVLDDAALLAALDSGHLAAAALDVFRTEPLPPDHPFWSHPGIHITPHSAGPTNQRIGPQAIARNIQRMLRGEAPHPVIDPVLGY